MSKILLIEDNNEIRENVSEILLIAGYKVSEAKNGKQGVEMATKYLPDLILCDITMPELDGYGVLYLLHKNEKTAHIPFIFITAKSERPDLRKGMEMGADDYLTKPFGRLELLSAVECRLKKKEQQQDFYSKPLENLGRLISKNEGLKELKKIITERKSRLFKKKQIVYYEGDRATGAYLIISGKVKTIKMNADGRELMTGMYETDDFLGFNAILYNETYIDSATVLEDSELCFFPKAQLEELLQFYPDVAGKFLKILSKDLRDKDIQLLGLAYQSVRKRIAESILRLFRHDTTVEESISISRDDLAAMSGTACETVSRTLTEFKNEGLIQRKGSHISILDYKRISGMKN